MGTLTFEKNLLSACINDRSIFKRARRAGIEPNFFSVDFEQYLFYGLSYLDKINNEFSDTAFEKWLMSDDSLDDRDRSVYMRMFEQYKDFEYSDINMTFDHLMKKKKNKDLVDTLGSAVASVDRGKDISSIVDDLKYRVDRLVQSEHDFEVYDYFEGFVARTKKRQRVTKDSGGHLKFCNNFAVFEKYFPLGLPPGTTTSVAGPTFVGKSVVLANIARMACDPHNGLDTIFIIAENSADQTMSRLDAIFLNRSYQLLFDEDYIQSSSARDDKEFLETFSKAGSAGSLRIVKVPSNSFDANTLRTILEDAVADGMDPKVVLLDSPDHQRPIHRYKERWMEKGQVYWDNKTLTEDFGIALICSTPMKASSAKKGSVSNEDVAGSYDIARIVDFQLMFNVDEQDRMLGRARLVVTKNREYGIIDNKDVAFRFKDSMQLVPFDEALQREREEKGIDISIHNFDEKPTKSRFKGKGD